MFRDGSSLLVSDEVGQIYYLCSRAATAWPHSQFDQFFLGDYRDLIEDLELNVLDKETELPPHERNLRDHLCDARKSRHPAPSDPPPLG